MNALARVIVAVALLGAATLWVNGSTARFRVVEPTLLENADFGDGQRLWRVNRPGATLVAGSPRVLVVPARGTEVPLSVLRRLPDGGDYDHVRVSVDLRVEGVPAGDPGWEGAQVVVQSFDRRGRRVWYWPRTVALLTGTADWSHHSRVFPRDPEIASMWLFLFVAADTGRMEVRDLRVEGVVERPPFTVARSVLLAGWAGAWLWAVAALGRRPHRSAARIGVVALATFVLAAGTIPQPHLQDSGQWVSHAVQDAWRGARGVVTRLGAPGPGAGRDGRVPAGEGEGAGGPSAATRGHGGPTVRGGADAEPGGQGEAEAAAAAPAPPRGYWNPRIPYPDQSGHVLAFFVLGLAAALAYRRYPSRHVVLALVTLSACIQVLQAFTITREPDLLDMQADCLGILLGAGPAYLALRVAARRLRPRDAPGTG